jgi:hypothetical protein
MVIGPSTIQGPQVRSIIIIFLMKRHYFGLKNININQFTWVMGWPTKLPEVDQVNSPSNIKANPAYAWPHVNDSLGRPTS